MSTASSITRMVLPEHTYHFKSDIDLMDESLREGAERATVPPTLEAKCDLAEAIAACGVRTIVVGMFPDVPHNIAFLAELLRRQQAGRIAAHVRFMVISHVGITMEQSFAALDGIAREHGLPLDSVWLIAIHSVSDQQVQHLFPVILRKDCAIDFDQADWDARTTAERRDFNLQWLDAFLPTLKRFRGGGVMIGLLDAFRADHGHLVNAVDLVARHGFEQVRLVDTAGTCLPHQLEQTVGTLVTRHPALRFYGHFHDDFGMATSNAIVGLSLGLQGVDVSVGGFANRAGHPALAEVAMALRKLYGIELAGFDYRSLFALSRLSERLYGLLENPAQAITGVITHSIQSGIRTELLAKAPTIFDILDPHEIGSSLVKMFGVRSGRDGLLRFLRETRLLEPHGLEPTAELADRLYPLLEAEWKRRSASAHDDLRRCIADYHRALNQSLFTEDEVAEWLNTQLLQHN
ncbi:MULTISPECIES: homocitrate synthase [Burkholderia]|uniref:homocitrate synthase n=1 Tax=Burkholderia TaxID=32008 RepID=UPI000841F93F|nr:MULTISPECIES: homocitrate synthase [unclassified Burkholderia]AOK32051.1 homocitrate synthase [Burkholderia sp. Bp7605]